jgi:hypothetical protein
MKHGVHMESPYIIFLLLTSLFFMTRSFSEGLFGDLTKVIDSDMNPKWLGRGAN